MMISHPFLRISMVLIWLALLPLVWPNQAGAESFQPKAGIHYDPIIPPVPVSGSKPEVVEVFNFKCPHCYKLHPRMNVWAAKMKDRFDIKSMPIAFTNQSDQPLRAYYAAQFLGQGDAMKHALFKAHFDDHSNIDAPEELTFIAEGVKLDLPRFQANLNSFAVNGKIAQGRSMSQAYGIVGTPTLVINGRYRVSPGKHDSNDPELLFNIVEALAAQ
ncbi:MAG: thiol:disulfide interchange protein DsbA/DsbL [Magnetococcus sp. YQC-5]